MADSLPICDVLSEAMEYLTKLGTNIRIRSEKLKDKRIRKDKLRNTHAIHKVVDKVLLICELSKKSIENVETGVKNLLTQMEKAGATFGPGPKTRDTTETEEKFEYFTYQSRRLKIRDKISIAHYTAVKVVCTLLTLSCLEKYPVYYDCNLYTLRDKVKRLQLNAPDSDCSGNNNKHVDKAENSCIGDVSGNQEVSLMSCETDRTKNLPVPELNAIDNKHVETGKPSSAQESENEVKKSDSTIEATHSGPSHMSTDSPVLVEDESEPKPKKKKYNEKTKKFKHIKVINSDSDSDNDVGSNKESTSDSNPNIHCNSEDETAKTEENEKVEEPSQSIDTNKPLIKCVSLSKLLKPERVKDLNSEKKISKKPNKENKQITKRRNSKSKLKKAHEPKNINLPKINTSNESEGEDEYWLNKRKEVENFKAKEFIIVATQLPKITPTLLEKYCLKKVTHMGSVICELSNAVNEQESSNKNCDENNIVKNVDLNKVKNALLHDSDSDNVETSQDTIKTQKNAALDQPVVKGQKTQLYGEKQNEKTGESESETPTDELKKTASNESTRLNEFECIETEAQELEKQIAETIHNKRGIEQEKQTESDNKSGGLKKGKKLGSEKHQKKNNLQNDNDDSSETQNSCTEDSDLKPQDKIKLKNILLQESDSEELIDNSITVGEENKSPLHESNCDKIQQNIEKSSNKDLDENTKDTQDDQNAVTDPETVKSNLLKDSSDDNSRTSKKRRCSGDSPPQSKRKHIRESMYAKKMLLTYSSSSDTEDEQLRNTLKEIRDHLLKGGSSDEDNNVDKRDTEKEGEKVEASTSKNYSSESDAKKEDKKINSEQEQSDGDSKDTSIKESLCGSSTDNSSKRKVDKSSATPDDSCSQNTDIQDDKEIDGLTNLSTLKKSYRRKPTCTAEQRLSRSRRRRMAKASGLISNEGFLEAESSSDAASLSGSDHADNVDLEDMPRVKLADINGDGIGHLAKDDLLGESDTSISHDEKKTYKKEEDTDEDNVKSKRRKAIAISSDSEAGSSRRKDNNMRLSDFEDSEDESSEPVKNKRKKKVVDSDASGGSSDNGKKKRRRIKTLDESDVSGSDTENEGRNKHGRKNIRKVMSKNQLEEATKKAAREEKERIARIAERQKLYNNLEFDESGKPDEVLLEKVILDFDPETKEPLIQVDRGLVKKLKPHQANGIKFMWDACFESVKRIKKDKGSGCILAHCMGLGKTLQVVSLTHTLLTHGSLTGVNRVLVVCPLSTVLNWVNEFQMWLKHAEDDYEVDVYELSKFKQNSERAFQLSQWFEHGGVCVLGYEMFRNLSADKGKKFKKKILKNFQESLVDPGPDLVVCDEGHLLKNEKTSLSQSMNRVKTRRRIVLTGTPLQNNLKEYYCMVQFVKPNLLGKYNEYLNRFVNPITNGQYTDSTEQDIRVMKRRSHVLHKMLDGAVQRRDYGVLAPFLPPKHEYVLFITLTDVQIKLYHHYLDNYSRRPQPGKSSGFLFPDFQSLQRIWTHPLVLKYNSERYELMQQKKRDREEEDSEGSLVNFINDDSTPEESSTEESSEDYSDMSDDSRKKNKKKKSAKKGKEKENKASSRRGTRANPIELDDDEPPESLEVKSENPTEWWMKLVSEEELEDMRNSHKLILLFDILRQCEAIGDKLLVFSQSLYSLDLIEHFLGKVDEATQAGRVDEKLGGHVGSWSPGVDYFRLDGSTSCENRSIWCKNFNRIDNQRARLFLISTRAGGLGINLVAANRVVIFDVSWNPSHDVQSIFRVYRFGQKKPCYVYRFLAMGTMEEKIYERQVTKQAISKRVIDEQQIDRHYAENDLAELYKFEPQPPVPRPLPPLPKDRLFAEMLKEHEAQIYKYHEHDSLLENKEEETLSEEERRAAWEDFENEKSRPPPQPFLSPYAMHNGMVQGLALAQQQQMAAMATISIAAMLRKNKPDMTEQELRDAVPLILATNPGMFGGYDYGLMPKMSEIYKYAQPGMINPGMMHAMNAGSGMSGASGMSANAMHYEPPWQRQQQQQQQMRLQQLMQHQNPMGAKYYAGGLGSRDPMEMAMQQQATRAMMHRPRARGRPPLAGATPRPPPALPANATDVVDLDSD